MQGEEVKKVRSIQDKVFDAVLRERKRQNKKHPEEFSLDTMYVVLGEEVGEVAKDIFECNYSNLSAELVQVMAVCMRMIEQLDRDELL